MKSMFHKITVEYPVATNMTSEQTFCFTNQQEASAFRKLAKEQGYKIVLHNFDYMMRATDALAEINIDMELTAAELAEVAEQEEFYNG